MKRETLFIKLIRIGVTVAFAFSLIEKDMIFSSQSLFAQTLPFNPASVSSLGKNIDFYIPQKLGWIERSWISPDKDAKTIYLLQDAHGNFEVQWRMARILEIIENQLEAETKAKTEKVFTSSLELRASSQSSLEARSSSFLIALEGASGALDYSYFKNLPDPEIRRDTAEFLMKNAKLNGPEFYAITSESNPLLYGIETPLYYLKNKKLFLDVLKVKDEVLPVLEELIKQLEARGSRLEAKNSQLISLIKFHDQYVRHELSLFDYCQALSDLQISLKIQNPKSKIRNYVNVLHYFEMEKEIHPSLLGDEERKLLDVLGDELSRKDLIQLLELTLQYRMNELSINEYYLALIDFSKRSEINLKDYPNIDRSIQAYQFRTEINDNQLMEEIREIEENLKLSFISDKSAIIFEWLYALKRMAELRGREDDLTLVEETIERLGWDKIQQFMGEDSAPLKKYFPLYEQYYKTIKSRDGEIAKNFMASFSEKNVKSAVLMVGGYHTPGLEKFFQQKNISYHVISPVIPRDSIEEAYQLYLKRMGDPEYALTAEDLKGIGEMLALEDGIGFISTDPRRKTQVGDDFKAEFALTAATLAYARKRREKNPELAQWLKDRDREGIKILYSALDEEGARLVFGLIKGEPLIFRFRPYSEKGMKPFKAPLQVLARGVLGNTFVETLTPHAVSAFWMDCLLDRARKLPKGSGASLKRIDERYVEFLGLLESDQDLRSILNQLNDPVLETGIHQQRKAILKQVLSSPDQHTYDHLLPVLRIDFNSASLDEFQLAGGGEEAPSPELAGSEGEETLRSQMLSLRNRIAEAMNQVEGWREDLSSASPDEVTSLNLSEANLVNDFVSARDALAQLSAEDRKQLDELYWNINDALEALNAEVQAFEVLSQWNRQGATIIDGRYRLVNKLGEGTTAETWEAKDVDGNVRAIKWMKEGAEDAERKIEQEYQRQLSASRDGGPAPSVYGYGYDQGSQRHFLVMDFNQDEDLQDYIVRLQDGMDEGTLSRDVYMQEMLTFFKALLTALGELHARGILHNDLKPENIRYNASKHQITFLDFGSSTSETEEEQALQQLSFLYAAPETRRTVQSDLYSAGVIFFNMIAASFPFGIAPGDVEVVIATKKLGNDAFQGQDIASISPPLMSYIRQILDQHVSQRFKNAAQALNELERITPVILAEAEASSFLARPEVPVEALLEEPAPEGESGLSPSASPSTPRHVYEIGTVMGHYQILEKLGEGGQGSVFRALDTNANEHVALKIISPRPEDDYHYLPTPEREAQIQKQVHDLPNNPDPAVREFGVLENGDSFIAMDDVTQEEGTIRWDQYVHNLRTQLVSGELTYETFQNNILTAFKELLKTLEEVHGLNLVHRDLKPANFFYNPKTNKMTLIDFGAAGSPEIKVRSGFIIGSLTYMSPETYDGNFSFKSDLFALGVILYMSLLNTSPFRVMDREVPTGQGRAVKGREKVTNVDPFDGQYEAAFSKLNSDLQTFFRGLLAKDVTQRMSTSEALDQLDIVLPEEISPDIEIVDDVLAPEVAGAFGTLAHAVSTTTSTGQRADQSRSSQGEMGLPSLHEPAESNKYESFLIPSFPYKQIKNFLGEDAELSCYLVPADKLQGNDAVIKVAERNRVEIWMSRNLKMEERDEVGVHEISEWHLMQWIISNPDLIDELEPILEERLVQRRARYSGETREYSIAVLAAHIGAAALEVIKYGKQGLTLLHERKMREKDTAFLERVEAETSEMRASLQHRVIETLNRRMPEPMRTMQINMDELNAYESRFRERALEELTFRKSLIYTTLAGISWLKVEAFAQSPFVRWLARISGSKTPPGSGTPGSGGARKKLVHHQVSLSRDKELKMIEFAVNLKKISKSRTVTIDDGDPYLSKLKNVTRPTPLEPRGEMATLESGRETGSPLSLRGVRGVTTYQEVNYDENDPHLEKLFPGLKDILKTVGGAYHCYGNDGKLYIFISRNAQDKKIALQHEKMEIFIKNWMESNLSSSPLKERGETSVGGTPLLVQEGLGELPDLARVSHILAWALQIIENGWTDITQVEFLWNEIREMDLDALQAVIGDDRAEQREFIKQYLPLILTALGKSPDNVIFQIEKFETSVKQFALLQKSIRKTSANRFEASKAEALEGVVRGLFMDRPEALDRAPALLLIDLSTLVDGNNIARPGAEASIAVLVKAAAQMRQSQGQMKIVLVDHEGKIGGLQALVDKKIPGAEVLLRFRNEGIIFEQAPTREEASPENMENYIIKAAEAKGLMGLQVQNIQVVIDPSHQSIYSKILNQLILGDAIDIQLDQTMFDKLSAMNAELAKRFKAKEVGQGVKTYSVHLKKEELDEEKYKATRQMYDLAAVKA
ncbi:MAG: protein kinase [Chlamydiae bacterium]|nr:protein kinase [Chlamydiota bacterium]